jgi:hypothetical protein
LKIVVCLDLTSPGKILIKEGKVVMFKKVIGIMVFMFILGITVPVFAQRGHDRGYRSTGARGYSRSYNNDRGRNDHSRRDRRVVYSRSYYGYSGYNSGYYDPYYYPTYYPVVVRRPRIYGSYGYRPRYHRRSGISVHIGF